MGKVSACNAGDAGDVGSIPGLRRSPGGGHGSSLQYPCLENPMDRGVWKATVHEVAKSQTQLKQLGTHAGTHISLSLCIYIYVYTYHLYQVLVEVGRCWSKSTNFLLEDEVLGSNVQHDDYGICLEAALNKRGNLLSTKEKP